MDFYPIDQTVSSTNNYRELKNFVTPNVYDA